MDSMVVYVGICVYKCIWVHICTYAHVTIAIKEEVMTLGWSVAYRKVIRGLRMM